MTECGFEWISRAGETITYTRDDGTTYRSAAQGWHRCIKKSGHVTDITSDDHRCCCGNDTWGYDDE